MPPAPTARPSSATAPLVAVVGFVGACFNVPDPVDVEEAEEEDGASAADSTETPEVDPARCPNRRLDPEEECDDGNTANDDACLSTCVAATCGDGFVQSGKEACDDGNTNDHDRCPSLCQWARCGDGFVQDGVEICDDGNTIDGDGCSSSCRDEWDDPSSTSGTSTSTSGTPTSTSGIPTSTSGTPTSTNSDPATSSTTGVAADPAETGDTTGEPAPVASGRPNEGAWNADWVWEGCVSTLIDDLGLGTTIEPTNFAARALDEPFCVSGQIAPDPEYRTFAMLNFNLADEHDADCDVTPPAFRQASPTTLRPQSSRLFFDAYNETGLFILATLYGPNGETDANDRWCIRLGNTSGTTNVPYEQFNTNCRDNSGEYYHGEPFVSLGFVLAGIAEDVLPFDFCIFDAMED